jgi:hypothetical protein
VRVPGRGDPAVLLVDHLEDDGFYRRRDRRQGRARCGVSPIIYGPVLVDFRRS